MSQLHTHKGRIVWQGNLGQGTARYDAYSRRHRLILEGKPDLECSAAPAFRGEPDKHNPEDLFLASIAACHMLFYLSLCARAGVVVVAYEDAIEGTLSVAREGSGRFVAITLRPTVTIARADDVATAMRLHDEAHARCFIASSCATPIRHEATVNVETREPRR